MKESKIPLELITIHTGRAGSAGWAGADVFLLYSIDCVPIVFYSTLKRNWCEGAKRRQRPNIFIDAEHCRMMVDSPSIDGQMGNGQTIDSPLFDSE